MIGPGITLQILGIIVIQERGVPCLTNQYFIECPELLTTDSTGSTDPGPVVQMICQLRKLRYLTFGGAEAAAYFFGPLAPPHDGVETCSKVIMAPQVVDFFHLEIF